MRKVALVGAHSSGKTTSLYYLAYKLKKMGEKLGIGHEVARECPYPLNLEGGTLTQLWILTRQIEREAQLENYYDKIIMDRSIYDSIAYSIYLTELNIMDDDNLKFVTTVAWEWGLCHPYTTLIYLKPLPLEDDPQRAKRQEYQQEIDLRLERVLAGVPYKKITVDAAPKEKRCKEVYRIIREVLFDE